MSPSRGSSRKGELHHGQEGGCWPEETGEPSGFRSVRRHTLIGRGRHEQAFSGAMISLALLSEPLQLRARRAQPTSIRAKMRSVFYERGIKAGAGLTQNP